MNKKAIGTIYIVIFVVLLIAFVGYAFWDNYQKNKINLNPNQIIIKPVTTTNTTINTTTIKITSTTYPNKILTPGFSVTMDSDFLCIPRTVAELTKNTSDDVKRQIFEIYGLSYPPTKQYQIDRYIPVSLGGSNDNIKNLWPQSVDFPGYNEKNIAENYLYRLMCNKTINITTAQERIKTDWVAVYNEVIK